MATRFEELYEEDFYVWTQRQAAALRRLAETRPNVGLDFPHLIEEVEDLGTSQRDAVRSQLRRVIEHCLKLEYSLARYPRTRWRDSIIDARAELDDKLSPSLRRDLEQHLTRLWAGPGPEPRTHCAGIASRTPPTCCRPTAAMLWTTCSPGVVSGQPPRRSATTGEPAGGG